MAKPPEPVSFCVAPDDPFAEEHGLVSAWIEDVVSSRTEHRWYDDVELKSRPSGMKLVGAKPAQTRRFVVAAVAQTRHWDEQAESIRARAKNQMERVNAHMLPGWSWVWGRRHQAETVVRTLMRRSLPFERQDLLDMLQWCGSSTNLSTYFAPIGSIIRALERYASTHPLDEELLTALKKFAGQLRSSHDKDAKRLATRVDQLYADAGGVAELEAAPVATKPPPEPAPAGLPHVLDEFKQRMGMLPRDAESTSHVVGPDQFPLADDSPLKFEHELISELFEEVVGTQNYHQPYLKHLDAGRKLLDLQTERLGNALLAAAERHIHALVADSPDLHDAQVWQSRHAAAGVVAPLARQCFSLPRAGAFDFLLYLSVRPTHEHAEFEKTIAELISSVEDDARDSPLTEGERYVLSLFRVSRISGPALGTPTDEAARLTQLIGDGACFCLVPGEAWTDAVNRDFTLMDAKQRQPWSALFGHTLTATSARPSAKWLKTADKLVEDLGGELVRERFEQWLPLVAKGQSVKKLGYYSGDARGAANTMNDENATCLRGLLWLAPTLPSADKLVRLITSVALSAYKKVPGVGPRAVKVGNAAVYALSNLASTDAVGQLAMLKVRVRFGTAQKEIEKAFNATAEALDLPRDQIEEMGVPSYGLEADGTRCESLGDYEAKLVVTGSEAQLRWFDAKGKQLKSMPAKVKKDHKEDLKDLQQSLKDIQGMLPAQRDRIDSMFLMQKSWPIDQWSERYLQHALVGTIARRLLWCIDGTAALFVDGVPTNIQGETLPHGKTAEITLWHPVGRSIEEITSWRRRLEELAITQPFKQAHREIYLLTDAERNTGTYSNRFAAHVIRQHQFNALCSARGWKNTLRLMVDSSYLPPFKELPLWGLRAEFWVDGIGDGYGTDTNESGVFLRLATDQVRFYRTGAARNAAHAGGGHYISVAAGRGEQNIDEPLPLEQIPPLVFSEVMRDVDLFVGVASVGNDPTWQDGGPEGVHRDYWHNFSFGELSGTAATRKQVLERLVPRLKIADRCSFSDRFLIVSGQKRTYKIHLGSGNILMEPNDQYLCIVPDARSRTKPDELFLPFEGDSTLSIILSKALLLAEDTKIKDPTITRQIDARS